jgi:uncharacterized protein (TIGR02466 family)
MFADLIYSTNLSHYKNLNDYFYTVVKESKKQNVNPAVDWRCDTFNTAKFLNLNSDENFLSVLNDIKTEVIRFSKEFGVLTNNIVCTESWLNLAEPGNYQEYHMHAASHFSIVYYVRAPKDCGNIVFKSHEAMSDMFPIPAEILTPANFKTYSYTPKDNNLLIFRSNLNHMVEKNMSQEDRVSISANFYLKR